MNLPLVQGGIPENPEDYSVVRRGELHVDIPKNKTYEGDTPRIIRFKMSNGDAHVGVRNETN